MLPVPKIFILLLATFLISLLFSFITQTLSFHMWCVMCNVYACVCNLIWFKLHSQFSSTNNQRPILKLNQLHWIIKNQKEKRRYTRKTKQNRAIFLRKIRLITFADLFSKIPHKFLSYSPNLIYLIFNDFFLIFCFLTFPYWINTHEDFAAI